MGPNRGGGTRNHLVAGPFPHCLTLITVLKIPEKHLSPFPASVLLYLNCPAHLRNQNQDEDGYVRLFGLSGLRERRMGREREGFKVV